MLVVLFCVFFETMAQEYKAEREELKKIIARFEPQPITYRINPNSTAEGKNRILIDTAEFKGKFSSKDGIFYDKVSYRIVPKSNQSVTVFYQEKDSLMDGGIELFVTEESMYRVKIPELSWAGDVALRSEDEKAETYEYIKSDEKSDTLLAEKRIVKDGEYVLKINLLRYNRGETNGTVFENVADVQESFIVIDTTPPKIDFDILLLCENNLEETYSYAIASKSEYAGNYDYMAHHWKVFVNETEYFCYPQSKSGEYEMEQVEPDFAISLPLVRLSGVSNSDKVSVVAIDDLGNINTKDFQGEFPAAAPFAIPSLSNVVSASVSTPSTDSIQNVSSALLSDTQADKDDVGSIESKSDVIYVLTSEEFSESPSDENFDSQEKESRIEYCQTIRNALLSFCSEDKLDLSEPFNGEFQIDQSVGSFSYDSLSKLYICFDNGTDEEIRRIPLNISDDSISFVLKGSDFKKGMYQIFISDLEGVELRLCNKYIYSSNQQLKIVTKTGFDGRSFLDVDDIIFPPSGSSFLENEDLRKRNLPILNSIVSIINDNIADIEKIEILGYANPVLVKKGSARLSREEEEALKPISLARAEYVKNILLLMGIPDDLMKTVPCGGKNYEYNPSDKKANYQNRRVRINLVLK